MTDGIDNLSLPSGLMNPLEPTLQVHARKSNMLLWLALYSVEDV
jgi:hypothetical protein